MAEVTRHYTLNLTIHVANQEDEEEIDHTLLLATLEAIFPTNITTDDGRVTVSVTHREITRNYMRKGESR